MAMIRALSPLAFTRIVASIVFPLFVLIVFLSLAVAGLVLLSMMVLVSSGAEQLGLGFMLFVAAVYLGAGTTRIVGWHDTL